MRLFVPPSMLLLLAVPEAQAHPGGLSADGCHNDRRNGGRHCHGAARSSPPKPARPRPARAKPPAASPLRALGGDAYYASCAAARAAGVTPLRAGDPGYRPGLDRDRDGVACE